MHVIRVRLHPDGFDISNSGMNASALPRTPLTLLVIIAAHLTV
jgi:hypothetical protein